MVYVRHAYSIIIHVVVYLNKLNKVKIFELSFCSGIRLKIIDFKSATQADSQSMTDDELRLANIYDLAVGLIIDIERGKNFSMSEVKAQMIEVLEILQEEL